MVDLDLIAAYGRLRRARAEDALRARGIAPRDAGWLLDSLALYSAHAAARDAGVPVPQSEAWDGKVHDTERLLALGPPFLAPPRPGLTSVEIGDALRAKDDADRIASEPV